MGKIPSLSLFLPKGWFNHLPEKISIMRWKNALHRKIPPERKRKNIDPKHNFWGDKNVNSLRGCIYYTSLFGRFQDIEDRCTTSSLPRSFLASHVGHEKLVSKINSHTWRWRWNKHVQRGYIFFWARVPCAQNIAPMKRCVFQVHHTFKHQLLNSELEYVATGLAMTVVCSDDFRVKSICDWYPTSLY